MNFPSVISTYLTKPGDKLLAEISPSGKKIVKMTLDGGNYKVSRVEYKNKIVDTISRLK